MKKIRNLSTGKVAIALISLHYGLGFLLGTSETIFNKGLSGMTYALSCALGLLLLSLIASYYWKKRHPIWILLGNFYGKRVKEGVCFLSWLWMIGIIASQVLGATFILNILGVQTTLGTILTISAISFISLLPVEKLSKLFISLLVLNSVAIIAGTFKITTVENLKILFLLIPQSFLKQNSPSIAGIAIPTILITILGMDFHQFVVQAKTSKKAVYGSLTGGVGLLLISFLPAVITFSSINNGVLPLGIDGKQVIPYLLLNTFDSKGFGFILVLFLLTTSLASGSALTRILTKTFQDFDFVPKNIKSRKLILMINALIIFFLSITGKGIISLIVCFYAIYISGVIIPFVFYLLQSKKILTVSGSTIFQSLVSGALSSLLILVFSKGNFLPKSFDDYLELFMIIFGTFSSLTMIISNSLIKLFVSIFEPKISLE